MSYAPEHCWYLERIGITELPNYILQNSKVGYFVVISKGIIGHVLENDFGPPPAPLLPILHMTFNFKLFVLFRVRLG